MTERPVHPFDERAILEADLRLAMRGYRIEDVDRLLGLLAQQVSAMHGELEALRTEVDRWRRGGPPAAGVGDLAPAATPAPSAPIAPAGAAAPWADAPSGPDTSVATGETLGGTPATAALGDEGAEVERPARPAASRRRRALVPSVVLTLGAGGALGYGIAMGDLVAVQAAIATSAAALVAVVVAVVATRRV